MRDKHVVSRLCTVIHNGKHVWKGNVCTYDKHVVCMAV